MLLVLLFNSYMSIAKLYKLPESFFFVVVLNKKDNMFCIEFSEDQKSCMTGT